MNLTKPHARLWRQMPPIQPSVELARSNRMTVLKDSCSAASLPVPCWKSLHVQNFQRLKALKVQILGQSASAACIWSVVLGCLPCLPAEASDELQPWWVDPVAEPSAALLFVGVLGLAGFSTWDLCAP